jgi:hypothetical protein
MDLSQQLEAIVRQLRCVPADKLLELGITITKMGVDELEELGWELRQLGERRYQHEQSGETRASPEPSGLAVVTLERLSKLQEVESTLQLSKLQLCGRFEVAVLSAAKTFGQHWRDQDGVNLSVLEALFAAVDSWEASEPPAAAPTE